MDRQKSTTRQVYRALIAVVGWFGLALMFLLANGAKSGAGLVNGAIIFFSYFTILSNVTVALSFTIPLLSPGSRMGNFFSRPSVRTGIAVYISIVGVIYSLVLANLWRPVGAELVGDVILHYVIPVAYVIDWTVFVPKGTLGWRNTFSWLAFPLIYLLYTLIHGASSGFYPYPFVDVAELGFAQVLLNSLFLMVAFIAIGLLFITIDHWIRGIQVRSNRPQESG